MYRHDVSCRGMTCYGGNDQWVFDLDVSGRGCFFSGLSMVLNVILELGVDEMLNRVAEAVSLAYSQCSDGTSEAARFVSSLQCITVVISWH